MIVLSCMLPSFQLTRSLRSATLAGLDWSAIKTISTHTLLAERDVIASLSVAAYQHFNSHAPCGARPQLIDAALRIIHFNSHAPCGARR